MTKKRPHWDLVPFGSLADFRNGVNFTKQNFGQGIKVINVKDFHNHFKPPYVELGEINPDDVVGESDLLQDGDILFVRSNGNRELIGRSMFIKGAGEPVTHSAFTIRARIQSAEALPLFYAYALRSDLVRRALSSRGGGTNINNLNQGILGTLQVPKPPLPTQRKIAAVLSAYDDQIENNTRRIKLLEQMAQALYRERFVRPCQSGRLPKGWQMTKIGQVADINAVTIRKGQEPEEIDYIDISSVTPGSIEKAEHYAFADAPGRARRIVKHGDLIWSCVRPNRRSYALILEPQPNLIVSTGFAVISAKTTPYTYLYHALTTNEFVNYLTNHARGAAYPAVTAEDFANAALVLPTTKLLDQFHAVAAPHFDLSHNLHEKNANLRRTRDLLLPKLIAGEIRVSTEQDTE